MAGDDMAPDRSTIPLAVCLRGLLACNQEITD
jgi:hypothetical protein